MAVLQSQIDIINTSFLTKKEKDGDKDKDKDKDREKEKEKDKDKIKKDKQVDKYSTYENHNSIAIINDTSTKVNVTLENQQQHTSNTEIQMEQSQQLPEHDAEKKKRIPRQPKSSLEQKMNLVIT